MKRTIEEYKGRLKADIERIYGICEKARSRGLDPERIVEAKPAGNLADRVEGLVGPVGIADIIREGSKKSKNPVSYVVDSLLDGKRYSSNAERKSDAEQIVRTSLAMMTEGVVAAPIEGISDVSILKNPDGSEYLSISFAGPIRSAGGTAQGLAVLVGEYVAKKMGLAEFRPTKDEIERYVEEIRIYNDRVNNLQYNPSEDEIRHILSNLKVCVTGDATERIEVNINRDLERFQSNRIRGGMCLVIAEGVAQKSRKLMKKADTFGIDWSFLGQLKDMARKQDDASTDSLLKPKAKFMSEVVGGRPIFSAPSAKGAFRLRYGHSRNNGIAAKSMNPATLVLLDDFIATGTQVKVEKPGKGCIVTECDSIDGPIVRLKSGDVIRVEGTDHALSVYDQVDEILFLGDILVTYGDFLQTNTTLVPSGYVIEWWVQEARGANPDPTPKEAVEQCMELGIHLHPKYSYYFRDVTAGMLSEMASWLSEGEISGGALRVKASNQKAKRSLEEIGVPHKVRDGRVIIEEYEPLLAQLGFEGLDKSGFEKALKKVKENADGFTLVKEASRIRIRCKSGQYIGCRMGRPEKARERRMQPAVHALFPIGNAGGRQRMVNIAIDKNSIEVEVSAFWCPQCQIKSIMPICGECKKTAKKLRNCGLCGYSGDRETCPMCSKPTRMYSKTSVDLGSEWKNAVRIAGKSTNVKAVQGMISESKIPEPLAKGLLRALNDVYVFKDGTIRFDATDAPLTHFKPSEIGTCIERLKELGYTTDWEGAPLTDPEQVIELFPQDIIVAEYGMEYLLRVSTFIDQLLKRFYGLEEFHKAEKQGDLIGELVVGLAPHTSAGVIGRIIGCCKANVIYAHPFWHAAKRRNADGDEDAIMLLTDTLLNFSKSYLPEKRGGKMDAPLVVTTIMNAREVDDEAHKLEIGCSYPLKFYEATLLKTNPSDVEIATVKDRLEGEPDHGLGFTHGTNDISGPVHKSRYVTLDKMREKIDAQLAVAEKIRAIDEKEVAHIVINSHFMRDTYGNLRAFSRQRFRCVKCNANYRRVPLCGKCSFCGGRLLLTVSKGNITKYLKMSQDLAEKYGLSDYLKSRLELVEKAVDSLMTNDLEKQVSLADFM